MYDKILVPVDGSENSECVLEPVRAIATGCRVADVILLHVIDAFPAYYMNYKMSESFIRQAQEAAKREAGKYLDGVADKLKRQGVMVTAIVLEGNAASNIIDYAAKNNVDLIIMATHGRTGLARWALGSVADKVLREANRPVMVVPPVDYRVNR